VKTQSLVATKLCVFTARFVSMRGRRCRPLVARVDSAVLCGLRV
jgi:hypothetical protein